MFSFIIFELASDQAAQFLRFIAKRHGEFAIVFQRLNGLAALTFQSVNALVRPFARIPSTRLVLALWRRRYDPCYASIAA